MTEAEVREESARFGLPPLDELELMRSALKDEIGRRWLEENRDAIAKWNTWVEKNGLPLERYRCW